LTAIVGARLRVLRAVREISAEKLADALGVTVLTVTKRYRAGYLTFPLARQPIVKYAPDHGAVSLPRDHSILSASGICEAPGPAFPGQSSEKTR
jgi:hypothetical protein